MRNLRIYSCNLITKRQITQLKKLAKGPNDIFLGRPRGARKDGQHYLSFQFSRSVVSDSLRPHELQHARPPCPSPTPRVHSNSRPLSQWCHPAISSSVAPFSSCPQCLPGSESFPMSQLLASGGQSIGVSALASVLPKNTQDWLDLLAVQGILSLGKRKWTQEWEITSYPLGRLLSKPQETTELMRMWRNWNPCALLVGIYSDAVIVKNCDGPFKN